MTPGRDGKLLAQAVPAEHAANRKNERMERRELLYAVVRDAIACKPAVIAETDDWVAMASEFRALAHLPGVDNANIWEPEPEVVYAWTR